MSNEEGVRLKTGLFCAKIFDLGGEFQAYLTQGQLGGSSFVVPNTINESFWIKKCREILYYGMGERGPDAWPHGNYCSSYISANGIILSCIPNTAAEHIGVLLKFRNKSIL